MAVQAQQTVVASGGNGSGSNGTVSYTVGQNTYSSFSGTNGSVNEGVQQPYEISVVTRLEHNEVSLTSISVYPNPAKEYLNLKIAHNNVEENQYTLSLCDINGKVLYVQKIINSETKIDMNSYNTGLYFILVSIDNQLIKNFKIIKH